MCDTQEEAKRLAFGTERHKVLKGILLNMFPWNQMNSPRQH